MNQPAYSRIIRFVFPLADQHPGLLPAGSKAADLVTTERAAGAVRYTTSAYRTGDSNPVMIRAVRSAETSSVEPGEAEQKTGKNPPGPGAGRFMSFRNSHVWAQREN